MLWLKVHSHLLLRACLLSSKRKLPPQACQVRPGLHSVDCHPRDVQFPGTSSVRVFFQVLEPTALLVHPVLAAIAEDAVAAHSSATDGAWKLACRRSSPVPQIIIFVFPAFTLSPFFSIASFHVKSLLTHSSSDSAMITRSSA